MEITLTKENFDAEIGGVRTLICRRRGRYGAA